MRGVIVVNGYARDPAYLYQSERMREELIRLGVGTDILPGNSYPVMLVGGKLVSRLSAYDFCLFWDKDAYLLAAIDKLGIPLFNPARGIRLCDDKMETCIALADAGIPMPKTLPAPLCYTQGAAIPFSEVETLEDALGYPIVVKESFGSLGCGVSLAEDRPALLSSMERLKGEPHLYQQYIAESRGRDARVITVGGEVVGGMLRESRGDFRSNIGAGGRGTPYQVPPAMARLAERVADILGLVYCGIDFLFGEGGAPLVCEVNSNAFFAAFERVTGINVAARYAAEIVRSMEKRRGASSGS